MNNRFNPRLTGKGWRIVISSLALTLFGIFFRDFLLLGIAIIFAAITLIQLIKIRAEWRKATEIKIEPQKIQAKLIASDTLNTLFTIQTTAKTKLFPPTQGSSLQPSELEIGETEVKLIYKSIYFGEYGFNKLDATLTDPYNFFEASTQIPLTIKISVYPKTTQAITEAVRFLEGEDIYSQGEEPTRFRGSGFEYADTRAYVRGDSLRRLDWKATARLNKLMVKDYYIEGGAGVNIIFDGRAPDPISHDELTEALVRTSLSFARRDIPLGLTTIGVEETKQYTDLRPYEAVALALKIAFEQNQTAAEPAYELLDPQSSGKMRNILQTLNIAPQIAAISDEQYPQHYQSLEDESRKLVIYITSLQGDLVELLNIVPILRAKGWELEVLQPTRPWLHTQTLEESKRQSDYYSKVYRALDRERVKVEINTKK